MRYGRAKEFRGGGCVFDNEGGVAGVADSDSMPVLRRKRLTTRTMRPFSIFCSATLLCVATVSLAQGGAPASHGISIANMDQNVSPGDNFYLYADGGYATRTQLPPDR